jgi:hypothetical protein
LRVNRSEHYWKLQIWEVKDLTVVNNRLVWVIEKRLWKNWIGSWQWQGIVWKVWGGWVNTPWAGDGFRVPHGNACVTVIELRLRWEMKFCVDLRAHYFFREKWMHGQKIKQIKEVHHYVLGSRRSGAELFHFEGR